MHQGILLAVVTYNAAIDAGGGCQISPVISPILKRAIGPNGGGEKKRKRNTRTPTLQKTNHGWLYANREWGQSSRQQPEPIQGERSPGCIRVLPQPRWGVGVLVCCRSVALPTQPADIKFKMKVSMHRRVSMRGGPGVLYPGKPIGLGVFYPGVTIIPDLPLAWSA